jgi:hypothetical protein
VRLSDPLPSDFPALVVIAIHLRTETVQYESSLTDSIVTGLQSYYTVPSGKLHPVLAFRAGFCLSAESAAENIQRELVDFLDNVEP